MTYKKPNDVTYVDMAIYIDNNIHNPDALVQEKCFEYMWHLFYILAVKRKFFTNIHDYDEYALFGAARLYLRYQRENDIESKKLQPVRSSLNYIKKILYPTKVRYQKAFFEEVINTQVTTEDNLLQMQRDGENQIRKTTSELLQVEYTYYLSSICKTIHGYLRALPYCSDSVMMHNIYISCLLTILKTITISNRNKAKLNKKLAKGLPYDSFLDRLYEEETKDNVVLYHLSSTMENYIKTIVAKLKKEIAKDLRMIIGSFEPTEQVIKDILKSPTGGNINEQYNSSGT